MITSICMITYNQGAFIETAIQSIVNQKSTYPFELVIGDDYSKDNTKAICSYYQNLYPYISYRPADENLGIAKNFFRTLSHCNGRYIAICEGDDYWTDPLKLQKQISFLEDHPDYGLVFGDFISVDLKGTIIEKSEFYKQMPIKNSINGFCFNEFFSNKFDIRPATAVFRRDLINEELQNWPEYVYDVWLFQRILFKTKIFKFDEVFAAYRNAPSSITKSDNFRRYIQFAIFDNIVYFSEEAQNSSNRKETRRLLFKKSIGMLFFSDLPSGLKTKLFILSGRLFPGFKTFMQMIGQSKRLKRILKFNLHGSRE